MRSTKLHIDECHENGAWYETCATCRASIVDNMACAVVAIRRMQAPWVEKRHRAILWAIASSLPDEQPTHADLAAWSGYHTHTIANTLPELRVHGVLDWIRLSGTTYYTIDNNAIRALQP